MFGTHLRPKTNHSLFAKAKSLLVFSDPCRAMYAQAQLEALLAALCQEVALIQGPPGTGKVRWRLPPPFLG